MTRDLTKAQFDAMVKKLGFQPQGFMGYYRLPIPGKHYCVSAWNGGKRRRDQLAYLVEALAHEEARM